MAAAELDCITIIILDESKEILLTKQMWFDLNKEDELFGTITGERLSFASRIFPCLQCLSIIFSTSLLQFHIYSMVQLCFMQGRNFNVFVGGMINI